QVRLDELEVLLCVERRRTLDPRMDRVRRDDVELLVRRQNVMPRVVVDDLHTRLVYDVVVLLREERRDHARNQRLDLADDDALDARVEDERSCRHTGAKADDEHGMWIGMPQD